MVEAKVMCSDGLFQTQAAATGKARSLTTSDGDELECNCW